MIQQISTLGKILSKTQQKKVKGGHEPVGGCPEDYEWNPRPQMRCCWHYRYQCCYATPECPAPR
ncbi:hypothetical protein ABW636_05345 [Aquimarina sp. 2201CG1-2-11]|uniref:hypothetical protein n=1 Tax=Aquimarina discodermiae TaxID=3231043 RepID=UPI0034631030